MVITTDSLAEYSSNYSQKTGSLCFYSKDQTTDSNANITNTDDFKSFKYKAKLLAQPNSNTTNGVLKNATIAVPLKYLSNFWKSLKMPLINFKVENLNNQSTAFCLQLVLIMIMLILII